MEIKSSLYDFLSQIQFLANQSVVPIELKSISCKIVSKFHLRISLTCMNLFLIIFLIFNKIKNFPMPSVLIHTSLKL